MSVMITITSDEAVAFAHANPAIKRFINIDLTPIDASTGWACHVLASQLGSLFSILSVGGSQCDQLALTTLLAMQRQVVPGRLIAVLPRPEDRKRTSLDCDEFGVPCLNILCGDIEHKVTFFQAQEFGPFDVLFMSGYVIVPIQQRWCELLKPGGRFVVSGQIEKDCGAAMVQPEYLIGDVCIRRKP